MKITGVKSTFFLKKPGRRIGDTRSPEGRVQETGCLVELGTDAGLTGIGIAGDRVRGQIERLVEEVLMGEDPRSVSGLWRRMMDARSKCGQGGLSSNAISALDVALWDLKAKANSEPLWKTLGGARPRANAYASGKALPVSDEGLFEWYRTMASDYGLRAGKLKVGLHQEADLRHLGLMSEALKPGTADPVLMIDADESWSPKQAIRIVREMEEQYDLTWVEGPARRWDFLGLKRVSDSIRAAVCSGENLDTLGEFLPHFHHHSIDVIQVNLGRLGITGALQVADAAYGFELPVTLGKTPGNIHAHLAAVMPYFMSMEVADPQPPEGIYTTDVRIEDGWAIAGDRPGNGLQVDRNALAAAAKGREIET